MFGPGGRVERCVTPAIHGVHVCPSPHKQQTGRKVPPCAREVQEALASAVLCADQLGPLGQPLVDLERVTSLKKTLCHGA